MSVIYGNLKTLVNDTLVPRAPLPTAAVSGASGTVTMLPHVLYVCGTMTSLTLALAANPTSDFVAEYHIMFDSGSTATTVTYPSGIKFPDGETPTIEANKTYEFSIVNNCLTYQWYA